MALDWDARTVDVLLNPRATRQLEVEQKLRLLPEFAGHIWLATSGTNRQKFVALPKSGFLIAAQAVNEHLNSDAKDMWLNPLPTFHVGGLSIWARAYLSGAGVLTYPDVTKQKWDVERFYNVLEKTGATLTSLVPAQLFDLIVNEFTAPSRLRAVVVGGGYVTDTIFKQATALGWPVAPTYGLTECCSQVAAAAPGEQRLKILSHVETSLDELSCLRLRSSALLTAYAYEVEDRMIVEDPKLGGWYRTNDIVTIQDHYLQVIGRNDDIIKIGGETVALSTLEKKMSEKLHQAKIKDGIQLITSKDERLGTVIDAVIEKAIPKEKADKLIEQFNSDVMPYERIRTVNWVDSIPRTILGKMIKRARVY